MKYGKIITGIKSILWISDGISIFLWMSINLKILECAVDSLDWNDVVGTPALWWKDRPIAANIATSALFHSSGWNPINEGIVVNPHVVL